MGLVHAALESKWAMVRRPGPPARRRRDRADPLRHVLHRRRDLLRLHDRRGPHEVRSRGSRRREGTHDRGLPCAAALHRDAHPRGMDEPQRATLDRPRRVVRRRQCHREPRRGHADRLPDRRRGGRPVAPGGRSRRPGYGDGSRGEFGRCDGAVPLRSERPLAVHHRAVAQLLRESEGRDRVMDRQRLRFRTRVPPTVRRLGPSRRPRPRCDLAHARGSDGERA